MGFVYSVQIYILLVDWKICLAIYPSIEKRPLLYILRSHQHPTMLKEVFVAYIGQKTAIKYIQITFEKEKEKKWGL